MPEYTYSTYIDLTPLVYINIIVNIVGYVFIGIALYTIAIRRGISAPYTAWIPFASVFLFGKIAEQFETAQKGRSKKYSRILLGLLIAVIAVIVVFYIITLSTALNALGTASYYDFEAFWPSMFSSLISLFLMIFLFLPAVAIPYLVFYYIAMHKVYKSLSPKTCTMFLILSIFFPISPFVLFALRNKDEGFIELNDLYRAQQQQQAYYNQYQHSQQQYYQQPPANPPYQQPFNGQYSQQPYGAQQYYQPPYVNQNPQYQGYQPPYNNQPADKNNQK